jgi:Flp pilus assembly protein TadD
VNLAQALDKGGSKDEARAVLDQVSRLKESEAALGRATVLLGLASQQRAAGQPDKALASLKEAAAAAPDLAEAQYRLGLALRERADRAGAEEALLRAVKLEPQSSRFRYEWARELAARGDQVAALDQLARAVELQPSLSAAQRELGGLALRAREWTLAARALRAALAWEAGDASLHRDLATALDALGERKEAALEREAAQQLDARRVSPRS